MTSVDSTSFFIGMNLENAGTSLREILTNVYIQGTSKGKAHDTAQPASIRQVDENELDIAKSAGLSINLCSQAMQALLHKRMDDMLETSQLVYHHKNTGRNGCFVRHAYS